jgi:hypothetical protein
VDAPTAVKSIWVVSGVGGMSDGRRGEGGKGRWEGERDVLF